VGGKPLGVGLAILTGPKAIDLIALDVGDFAGRLLALLRAFERVTWRSLSRLKKSLMGPLKLSPI